MTDMNAAPCPSAAAAAARVSAAITGWRAAAAGVLVVALDGHGASGKSTIAAAVADVTGAALVHTDDFFRWPASVAEGSARQVAPLGCYYDWRRIRAEALEPLRAGRPAAFRRFDWQAGAVAGAAVTVEPRRLVVLEGVFSAAPQLADLVDRAVLVDTPEPERLARLRLRVSPQEWDEDWLAAERAYFTATRPPAAFSLVVAGAADLPVLTPEKGTP